VEEFGRAVQDTENHVAHAHCYGGYQICKYTLILCNIFCSSTARKVVRTRHTVMSDVRCLSCIPNKKEDEFRKVNDLKAELFCEIRPCI